MQTVHHHNGDYKMATWPVRIDGKTVRLKGSPALGQDSVDVLHKWLGIGAGEVEKLRQEGGISPLGNRARFAYCARFSPRLLRLRPRGALRRRLGLTGCAPLGT